MSRKSTTVQWWKWAIALLVALGLVYGTVRTITARKAQQAAAAAQATQRSEAPLELAATDVVQPRMRLLAQGLPISGTLRAATAVVVKSKVAGELQGFSLREGDTVRAGQTIGRIDATDAQARVRQAEQQAASAQAQVDMAQRSYDNNKALVDQGFISRTALDTSANNLTAAQANHKAALAAVEVARKSLDDTVLRAPISGVVSLRAAQPGERVGVDARVIEIVDLSRLELEASLSAADSVLVRVGQQATLQIEGNAQPVAARVVRINPSAQAGSRSVLVYLGLDRVDGLRQGLFAQGTLGTARTSAVAVPLSAMRTDRPAPYVQVVENGKVVHKPVDAGARGRDAQDAGSELLVAVQGVPAGTLVIQGSVGSLREGTAVRFTPPAAARAP
jgi:multidrug efflux system membrane fusion protein